MISDAGFCCDPHSEGGSRRGHHFNEFPTKLNYSPQSVESLAINRHAVASHGVHVVTHRSMRFEHDSTLGNTQREP